MGACACGAWPDAGGPPCRGPALLLPRPRARPVWRSCPSGRRPGWPCPQAPEARRAAEEVDHQMDGGHGRRGGDHELRRLQPGAPAVRRHQGGRARGRRRDPGQAGQVLRAEPAVHGPHAPVLRAAGPHQRPDGVPARQPHPRAPGGGLQGERAFGLGLIVADAGGHLLCLCVCVHCAGAAKAGGDAAPGDAGAVLRQAGHVVPRDRGVRQPTGGVGCLRRGPPGARRQHPPLPDLLRRRHRAQQPAAGHHGRHVADRGGGHARADHVPRGGDDLLPERQRGRVRLPLPPVHDPGPDGQARPARDGVHP